MSVLEDYALKYRVAKMERQDGILQVTLHTDGDSLRFGSDNSDRYQLADAFIDIANDPENLVIILTGTGAAFCEDIVLSSVHDDPMKWDRVYRNRRRLLLNLLEIEAPIIAAINGPCLVHAEVALLSDIVLASDTVAFQDKPHFLRGSMPGDGSHVLWPYLLGSVRGKYYLLTGQRIEADEALRLGIVNEVLPIEKLLSRARELARFIVARPILSVRYTRAVLNLELRRLIQEHLGYGLALEGLAAVQRGLTPSSDITRAMDRAGIAKQVLVDPAPSSAPASEA